MLPSLLKNSDDKQITRLSVFTSNFQIKFTFQEGRGWRVEHKESVQSLRLVSKNTLAYMPLCAPVPLLPFQLLPCNPPSLLLLHPSLLQYTKT